MHRGIKMKKIYFILPIVLLSALNVSKSARAEYFLNKSDLIFIDSETSENMLKKYFGNMASQYSDMKYLGKYIVDSDDKTILNNVLDAYNDMLNETDGFVSVNGLFSVCLTAFQDITPNVARGGSQAELMKTFRETCTNFTTELVTTEPKTTPECPYAIDKRNGWQTQIRYTKPDGTGFIRKCYNYVSWRFFNPGNLRDSRFKCTIFDTNPNGKFAVFPNETIGWHALKWLLRSEDTSVKYPNLTARQAIYKFAPPNENNTEQYINSLAQQGIAVDTKILRDYTDDELDLLMKSIAKVEGWFDGNNDPKCEIIYFDKKG